jgi:hypothetical protein
MNHPRPTIEQLRKREAELIEAERTATSGKTSWWYLSYAGETKFNGGVIVRAFGFIHACRRARDLHINPGGQIHGLPLPDDKVPAPKYQDKWLSLEELQECWGDMTKLSELR